MSQPPRRRGRRAPDAAPAPSTPPDPPNASPDGTSNGSPNAASNGQPDGPPNGQPDGASAAARAAAKDARRGRALRRQAFLAERAGTFDERALDAAMAARLAAGPAGGPGARALPTSNAARWVPIGPSVVRRGQAEGRPRVTGRIRDLQVSADGRRAYAGSAKGGVWYTDDAGATWRPVAEAVERTVQGRGGNNNARTCGCLLVHFGATAADDYVMVGTGELVPAGVVRPVNSRTQGGVGVLAARGIAAPPPPPPPTPPPPRVWEAEAGIAQLEGFGIFRLARRPGRTPGLATGANADQVVAATSAGLFMGTRSHAAGPPAADRWTWAKLPALDLFVGALPQVTDVLWLTRGTTGRIIVTIAGRGVAFSDSLGAPTGVAGDPPQGWTWVTNLSTPGVAVQGRMSLAPPVADRVYVLGEVLAPGPPPVNTPSLWVIPNASAAGPAVPAAVPVPGVPAAIWTALGNSQRDYDQAIAVTTAGTLDRVFLGGSTIAPNTDWCASLWCFDVTGAPAAPVLSPAAGVSRTGAPLPPLPPPAPVGGDGADIAGLVGNNVHADVHAIRLVTPPAPAPTTVWVGCDGGVYVSAQNGRCNTFQPRATGLAVLEVGFHAAHPTSSHFAAVGCHDNGTQVRTGDTVWEETLVGDGGGVVFHPVHSQFFIAQYAMGTWRARPNAVYADPLARQSHDRTRGGREAGLATFYSGAAAVRNGAVGRIALGTNRVWLTEDLGVAAANTWRVIPFAAAPAPAAAPADPRPGGTDPPAPSAQHTFGVPVVGGVAGALGAVVQLRWASPTDLLALYVGGLVRYTETAATGVWSATVLIPGAAGAPNPANVLFTDLCPVPTTRNFYLTTGGNSAAPPDDTCWYYDAATGPLGTFHPTNLRHELDTPGPPPVLGPLDPAYAVVVDPGDTADVYVGTVTGVWRGTRVSPTAHLWDPFVNGLPQATVQDLGVWTDPAATPDAPRLLRAGVQARGLWELNLATPNEPQRTYLRVHARDDRRIFPTPMRNPRRRTTAPIEPVFASPDIVVRPASPRAAAPTWQIAAGRTINQGDAPPYQLWTFQTAFRWHYPSLAADGLWSDQLGDLVELHRATTGLPAGRMIDNALWTAVVGNTRLTAAAAVSAAPGDPLAVYRAPWESAAALGAAATEVDLMELVVPRREIAGVWQVFREPSTVDILLHHRDTRPLAPNDAFAVLLWRAAANPTTLLNTPAAAIPAYAASLLTGAPLATPPNWTLAAPAAGGTLARLGTSLEARLPRAVSVDVDLSAVPEGHHVLFLALAGSTADPFSAAPFGAPGTAAELARAWPHAALRLVRVSQRPA